MIVLSQIDHFLFYLSGYSDRDILRRWFPVDEAILAVVFVALFPIVECLRANAKIAAGFGNITV
jgi:hypothetical protein